MKSGNSTFYGFTLIEVLVSITILSLILASVFNVYISSTNINMKTDITRMLQQNIKSSIELISEDVRKNGYGSGVTMGAISLNPCNGVSGSNNTQQGTILCIGENNYYLAEKDTSGIYTRVTTGDCEDITKKCTLVIDKGFGGKPIMNSWVDIKKLRFLISGTDVEKVTILMTLQPAVGKGIKTSIIEKSKFYFQTTISQRINLK